MPIIFTGGLEVLQVLPGLLSHHSITRGRPMLDSGPEGRTLNSHGCQRLSQYSVLRRNRSMIAIVDSVGGPDVIEAVSKPPTAVRALARTSSSAALEDLVATIAGHSIIVPGRQEPPGNAFPGWSLGTRLNAPKGHTVSSRGFQPTESEHTPHHTRTLKGSTNVGIGRPLQGRFRTMVGRLIPRVETRGYSRCAPRGRHPPQAFPHVTEW